MISYMRKLKGLGLVALLALLVQPLSAQRVAVKTNALYWATATPNLGAEFRLNRHFTLNLEGAVNRLKLGDKINSKAIGAMPEVRYWFSARPQARHFVGVMGLVAGYGLTTHIKSAEPKNYHGGTAVGGGLTYGYSFVLGPHWSLETTAGLGLLSINERKAKGDNIEHGSGGNNNSKCIFAPTKLGVTFVYIFK